MQKLQNDTLQQFLENLIEGLKNENDDRKYHDLKKLNIPFIVSTLYQSFEKDTDIYKDFIADLKEYPEYDITFTEPKDDYYGIIDAEITLAKYGFESERYIYPDHTYKICFSEDERLYGYCDCTPDMPDYRPDKQCCGHGCDASFCEFTLYKILNIHKASWAGDEHDYWEFEDEFCKEERALAEEKEQEAKKREIQELQETIDSSVKRLAELSNDPTFETRGTLEKYKNVLEFMKTIGL